MLAHDATRPPSPSVLTTDLDGTLIPLENEPDNVADLQTLSRELQTSATRLVFVTGRHLSSVMDAIEQHRLPDPDWIVCDVGTSIYRRTAPGEFALDASYADHLQSIIQGFSVESLHEQLVQIKGLRLQEAEKQGRFKLSYYSDAERIEAISNEIQQVLRQTGAPYTLIHSIDPFNGDGLLDLLPSGVSKAHALGYWARALGIQPTEIVFAGDSGNDTAALTAGYCAILVANADRRLARQVHAVHQAAGWSNRLYLALQPATSGVREGCQWFGLVEPSVPDPPRWGATPVAHDRTHFRIWAPRCQSVSVAAETASGLQTHALEPDGQGNFSGTMPGIAVGDRYRYLLDGTLLRPDPASRWQPEGVHGRSQIVDWNAFPWTDGRWQGVARRDLVIYELHVGSFTESGTFAAAIDRLPDLVDLGITAIELMPVAQTPGRWNWGYDGVGLFAPDTAYGSPDDFRALVDACHAHGLAVILDVVYNHIGPEGNYLADFGPYFSSRHRTPWGEAFAFDEESREHVRGFVIENAIRWLDEYHLDGLRLDAVHCMHDCSGPHILCDLRQAIAAYAQTVRRTIHLIAEANVYDASLLRPEKAGEPYDGIWVDCLMHAIYSCAVPELQLTNRRYQGAADVATALRRGYVYAYDGQQPQRVAEPSETDEQVDRSRFVVALQTHDAVGNHPQGLRLHHLVSPEFQRAAAPLVLLNPGIPMVFMGEPEASAAAFPFFADFEDPALRKAVDQGRMREYPQHDWAGSVLPHDAQAFLSAKVLDRDTAMWNWYRDLLRLRRQGVQEGWLHASRLRISCAPEHHLFSMHYDAPDGSRIAVHVRLSDRGGGSQGQAAATPIRLDIPANSVLLAWRSSGAATSPSIELPLNAAVIARTPADYCG
ncbi:MAG: malto-oligosyltrehalose trehalohydrolase [Planctomycetota bacterium]|nr:MAG: malto-oligosyltrehalose trehalohydrolase [Planctomycetota bacterium]